MNKKLLRVKNHLNIPYADLVHEAGVPMYRREGWTRRVLRWELEVRLRAATGRIRHTSSFSEDESHTIRGLLFKKNHTKI